MIIRTARIGDAAGVAVIWNHEIREGVTTFTTAEKTEMGLDADIADRGDAFLVAEEAGELLGFATFFQFRGGPGYAHTMEYTIHLAPRARGKGAGRQLLSALEDRARAADVHILVAGISGENAAGVAFHERMGFEHVGRMPEVGRKFDRWMDLVLMQKVL
ncbi:phosphinothricin acetyltransferase [Shimia isoporae]|uniref:Phosphinothricin acetyltransferase n=1 Tax=Shimia isoporae TaxID=647720 RepID=A0A4R1NMC7_9RHOB|nr:GNAT family N-acetyltransferase [Shimia isoporae]TCL08899.1 phosphinothricin acetyltransferase [Shimia isoporae]